MRGPLRARSRPASSDTICPECGKPLTIGVLHRVAELADRPAGYRPAGAAGFTSLVQLPEIVGEILAAGPKSKKVRGEVGRLVAALGPELGILRDVPLDDLRRVGGSPLGEAIARLRRGEVIRDAGYDGEYGTIRLFQPDELDGAALFATSPGHPAGNGTRSSGTASPERPRPRRDCTGADPSRSRPGPAVADGGIAARDGIAARRAGLRAAGRRDGAAARC